MVMFLLVLFLCSCIISTIDGCTEGFMDIDLLRAKAEQIPNTQGTYSNNILDSDSRWIFPSLEFTCSTTITGIIIGVDVRTITNTRNSYPQLEIWTNDYVFIGFRTIQLQPDNFNTSGVYTYQFSQPLSVAANNVLGISQPPHDESVVRVHYESRSNGALKVESYTYTRTQTTFINNLQATLQNLDLIIYPLTDNPSCLSSGFQTREMIQSKVLQVTDVLGPTNTVRGFSNIRFTCDGIITKWIVGINDVTGNTLPNIQLLRSDLTVITSLTVDTNNGISTDTNVYEFTSLLNAEVKKGDILVVNSTDIPVYYQQFNGPQNYMIDSSNTLVEVEANNYPLISVEFASATATTATTMITTTTTTTATMITRTTFQSPAISTTTFQSPAISTSTFQSPGISTSTFQSPALSTTTFQSPAISTSTFQSPAISTSTFQSPAISTTMSVTPSIGFAKQWKIIGVGAGLLLLSIIIFTSILIVLLVKLQRAKHTNMKLIALLQRQSDDRFTVKQVYALLDLAGKDVIADVNQTNTALTESDKYVITDDNPSYNIHTLTDQHVTTIDNPSYSIRRVTDKHVITNDNPSYNIHTTDKHVVTNDNPAYNIHTSTDGHVIIDDDPHYI